MTLEAAAEYGIRFPALTRVADNLGALIRGHLAGVAHIDRVAARAKDPARFEAKASKLDDDGRARYQDPLSQIQDQIAARVIVFYRSDVARVATVLERYFRPLEREEHLPESHWEFGYFGLHWIFALPDDAIPEDVETSSVPRFFELQVKTLFQHAWSEANHDVSYKAMKEPSPDQQRRFAYTAAQAWGADRVFDELWQELDDAGSKAVSRV